MPKAIADNIVFVFTNCASVFDLNFDVKAANKYFGFDEKHTIPFICVDNPFVYTQRAQKLVEEGKASEQEILSELNHKFVKC